MAMSTVWGLIVLAFLVGALLGGLAVAVYLQGGQVDAAPAPIDQDPGYVEPWLPVPPREQKRIGEDRPEPQRAPYLSGSGYAEPEPKDE